MDNGKSDKTDDNGKNDVTDVTDSNRTQPTEKDAWSSIFELIKTPAAKKSTEYGIMHQLLREIHGQREQEGRKMQEMHDELSATKAQTTQDNRAPPLFSTPNNAALENTNVKRFRIEGGQDSVRKSLIHDREKDNMIITKMTKRTNMTIKNTMAD